MNIQFELIEAQNFKSIGEAITINYKDFSKFILKKIL